MARKVFKYGPIVVADGPQQVEMPVAAKIAFVGSKNDGFVDIWAVVDEDAMDNNVVRTFQIFGTGHPIPEDAQYMGTSIQSSGSVMVNGTMVWHLFERLAD